MPGVMNGFRDDYGHRPYAGGPYGHYDQQRYPDQYRNEPYSHHLPPQARSRDRDPYSRGEDDYARRYRDSGYPRNSYGYRDEYPEERESAGTEEAVFDLDHLATFSVGPNNEMADPRNCMHHLKQMENNMGIWTLGCQLVVESQDLVIVDKPTQNEMERFRIECVLEPTAITSDEGHDVYNNILLFRVDDPQSSSVVEVHMFQCIGKKAQDVVNKILDAKAGKHRFAGKKHYNGPDSNVRDQVREFEAAAERTAEAAAHYNPQHQPLHQHFKQSMQHRDETESVLSETTDRDVQLLNCCFDDIEKFVARLQSAAENFKELERRMKSRQNKHRRGVGDGMLSMRSRPPPKEDFIDVFQKFKLACNLVAKLKDHIHDPNAPELIHCMWTILCLLIDASKDKRIFTDNLPCKVVSPLLTYEAKELLSNCLTSKEDELWKSLGPAWYKHRDEWTGYVPPYTPRFSNGWNPGPSVTEEMAFRTQPMAKPVEDDYGRRPTGRRPDHGPEDDYRYGPPRGGYPHDHDNPAYASRDTRQADRRDDYQHEQRESRPSGRVASPVRQTSPAARPPPQKLSRPEQQAKFLNELKARNARIYTCTHNRTGRNQKELSVQQGEIVEVMDSSKNWWKIRNMNNEVGHAPYTIMIEWSGNDGVY